MAAERQRMSYVRYMTMPPKERPAMSLVDAVTLYQEFVHMGQTAPEEVKTAAMVQVNEGTPPGFVTVLEEYQGRLRVITSKK